NTTPRGEVGATFNNAVRNDCAIRAPAAGPNSRNGSNDTAGLAVSTTTDEAIDAAQVAYSPTSLRSATITRPPRSIASPGNVLSVTLSPLPSSPAIANDPDTSRSVAPSMSCRITLVGPHGIPGPKKGPLAIFSPS